MKPVGPVLKLEIAICSNRSGLLSFEEHRLKPDRAMLRFGHRVLKLLVPVLSFQEQRLKPDSALLRFGHGLLKL